MNIKCHATGAAPNSRHENVSKTNDTSAHSQYETNSFGVFRKNHATLETTDQHPNLSQRGGKRDHNKRPNELSLEWGSKPVTEGRIPIHRALRHRNTGR